jgi:hypothetical protein
MVMKGNNPSFTIFGEPIQENIPSKTRGLGQAVESLGVLRVEREPE